MRRQLEVIGGVPGSAVRGVLQTPTQYAVQRDALPRVEAVIEAGGEFAAVAIEGFALQKPAGPHLGIAVREPSASEAQPQVGLRPHGMAHAHFAVEVGGGHGQTQRQVRTHELGLVQIVEGINRQRSMPFERLVVAELQELPLDGVDLRPAGERDTEPRQQHNTEPVRR